MMASANMQGLDELRRTLLSLSGEIVSKNGGPVRSALAKGTKRVRDVARHGAPVGEGDKYGNSSSNGGRLRDAIVSVRDKNPGAEGLTESYVVRVKRGKNRADARGAYYWSFVEFGAAGRAAQPFLRPAFEQSKAGFKDDFAVDLKKAIESAVKRYAKNG